MKNKTKNLLLVATLSVSLAVVALQPKKHYITTNAYAPKENYLKNRDYFLLSEFGFLNNENTEVTNNGVYSTITYNRSMQTVFWANWYGLFPFPTLSISANRYTHTNLFDTLIVDEVNQPLTVRVSDDNFSNFSSLQKGDLNDVNDMYQNNLPFMPNNYFREIYGGDAVVVSPEVNFLTNPNNSWFNTFGFKDEGLTYSDYFYVSVTFYTHLLFDDIYDINYINFINGKWFGTYGYAMSTLQSTDYQNGYDDGYSDGYQQGDEDGYYDGYDDGVNDGFTDGYNDGKDDGFDIGYQEALDQANLMSDTIFGVLGGIVGFMASLSGFELMGVSLLTIITFFVGIGLIILILKVIGK